MTFSINITVYLVRLWLTIRMFNIGTPASLALGTISALALLSTATAWRVGISDKSLSGCAVGVGYLVTLLLRPAQWNGPWIYPFWLAVIADVVVKFRLWDRTTVTAPVWVGLEDKWPYSVVRHPMTLAEIVIVASVLWGAPTLHNLVASLVCITTKVLVIGWEEKFLNTFQKYRLYSERVQWRLFPKVW